MNSNLWTNKYKPLNINDIYGHEKEINEIYEWLENKKKNALIISGANGIGKNTTIKLILITVKLQVIFII